MSFRARVALLSAAAVALAIVLASALVYIVVRDQLRDEIDGALRGRAERVLVPNEFGPPDFELDRPFLGGAHGYAQLVTADGDAVRPAGAEIPLPTERAVEVAAGRRDSFFEDATVAGTHVRLLTKRVAPNLALQIARPLDEVDRTLDRLALILAVISAGGIAVAAAFGLVVSRAALAPVRRLTDASEHVTRTRDLTRRIDVESADELGRLACSFNAMLQALEESIGAQRQLVADASHELRTPLTSLRTNVEVLECAPDLPQEERAQILRDVNAQLEELTALVAALVELARGTEAETEPEDVELDELVADAVERARRHAPEVRFETRLEPTTVRGVPARIERAVANLLDNAAKWSGPGATVEVDVRDREITVRDHGPGIDDADLPHVFDRFYRAAGARGIPGSGLGLAIVRQVAEAHGGSVSAERAAGGGALLRLRLSASS